MFSMLARLAACIVLFQLLSGTVAQVVSFDAATVQDLVDLLAQLSAAPQAGLISQIRLSAQTPYIPASTISIVRPVRIVGAASPAQIACPPGGGPAFKVENSSLQLQNVIVTGCTLAPAVVALNSDFSATSTRVVVTATGFVAATGNGSQSLRLVDVQLTSSIRSAQLLSGGQGAVHATGMRNVYMGQSSCRGCAARTHGGCMHVDVITGSVIVENSTFDSCTAGGRGGALALSRVGGLGATAAAGNVTAAAVKILNSTFSSNRAAAGGAISIGESVGVAMLSGLLMTGNAARPDLAAEQIATAAAAANITDTDMIAAPALEPGIYGMGGAVLLTQQSAVINSSRFSNNTAITSGGAIWGDPGPTSMATSISLSNSSLHGNAAPLGGALAWLGRGGVALGPATNFDRNVAIVGGGAVVAGGTAQGVTFTGNTAVGSAGSNATSLLGAAAAPYGALLVGDAAMSVGSTAACALGGGGALCYTGLTALAVDGCRFTGNLGIFGGGMYVAEPSQTCAAQLSSAAAAAGASAAARVGATISNTHMLDNRVQGGAGGAVYTARAESLAITTCPEYEDNSTALDDPFGGSGSTGGTIGTPSSTGGTSSSTRGQRGAVPISHLIPELSLVPWVQAAESGGAAGAAQMLLPCVDWGQQAGDANVGGVVHAGYGPVLASGPYFALPNTTFLGDYNDYTPDPSLLIKGLKVSVSVHDYWGQLATVFAAASGSGNEHASSSVLLVASNEEQKLYGQLVAPVVDGVAKYTNLQMRGEPGNYSVTLALTGAVGAGVTPAQVVVGIRECRVGEVKGQSGDFCFRCDALYFSFNPSSNECQYCPENARCSERPPSPTAWLGQVVPVSGFWQSNPFSTNIVECPNRAACDYPRRGRLLGQFQDGWIFTANLTDMPQDERDALTHKYRAMHCAPGYQGHLCAQCDVVGYGAVDVAECRPCPSAAINSLYYSLTCVMTVAGLLYTLYSSLATARQVQRAEAAAFAAQLDADGLGPPTQHQQDEVDGVASLDTPNTPFDGPNPRGAFNADVPGGAHGPSASASTALLVKAASLRTAVASRLQHAGSARGLPVPVPAAAHVPAAGEDAGEASEGPEGPELQVLGGGGSSEGLLHVMGSAAGAFRDRSNGPISLGLALDQTPFNATSSLSSLPTNASLSLGPARARPPRRSGSVGEGGPVAEGLEAGGACGDRAAAVPHTAGLSRPHAALARLQRPEDADEVQPGEEGLLYEDLPEGAQREVTTMSGPVSEGLDDEAGLGPRGIKLHLPDAGMRVPFRNPRVLRTSLPDVPASPSDTPPGSHRSHVHGAGVSARLGGGSRAQPISFSEQPSFQRPASLAKPSQLGTSSQVGDMEAAVKDIEEMQLGGTIVKILVSYLQVISMIRSIPLDYPRKFLDFLTFYNTVVSMPGQTVSLDCSLPNTSTLSKPMIRVLLAVAAPLYVGIAVTVFWLLRLGYLVLRRGMPLAEPIGRQEEGRVPSARGAGGACAGVGRGAQAVAEAVAEAVRMEGEGAGAGTKLDGAGKAGQSDVKKSPWWRAWLEWRPKKKGRMTETPQMYLHQRLVFTFYAVFFYFYPTVVQALLSIFSCTTIDPSVDTDPQWVEITDPKWDYTVNNATCGTTVSDRLKYPAQCGFELQPADLPSILADGYGLLTAKYWQYDMDQECYEGKHAVLSWAVGVPGLVIVGLGLPLANCIWLVWNRYMLASPSFMALYAFLYAEYEHRVAFWESAILLRKLAIAAVVVFMLNTELGVQVLCTIAVIVAALLAQHIVQPYQITRMDRLERLSLIATIATLYISLFFMFESVTEYSRRCLSFLLIAVNAAVVCTFVLALLNEYKKSALLKVGLNPVKAASMRRTALQHSLSSRYHPAIAAAVAAVVAAVHSVEGALRCGVRGLHMGVTRTWDLVRPQPKAERVYTPHSSANGRGSQAGTPHTLGGPGAGSGNSRKTIVGTGAAGSLQGTQRRASAEGGAGTPSTTAVSPTLAGSTPRVGATPKARV